ncbi:MAG: AEC family transporter [Clostridiales bacterium]|nr:AEC family transporter [Clostridiales bacterium]
MPFQIAVTNVLVTLLFILPGFFLSKLKKAASDHLSTLSGVLVYACSPCMIACTFISLDFSRENLVNMLLFFLVSLVLQGAFMAIIYGLCRKRIREAKYRILTIGSVLGNVGFFGLPIVRALLPDHPEVACYSSMIVISMNILVFTMGVFCLTGDKKYMTLKSALINPTMLGFIVGFPLFLLSAKPHIPDPLYNAIDALGNMSTPLCMLILGIRLAAIRIKPLFTRPIVYLICLCKLLLFPLFAYGCVYFLPLPQAFKASVLILTSVPCASVILGLAEIHHSETELSANCVLVSTLMCFLTIPVLTLLL